MSADDRLKTAPEQAMVDDHQVRTQLGGGTDRRLGCVHRGHNRLDLARPTDLESIERGRVVGMIGHLQPLIQIMEHRF